VVEEIVGDDFEVGVLVPSGASPETYEPTPLQIRAVEDARLVFSTGLIGFETVMLERLSSPERVVDLSDGIELIAGDPGHEPARNLASHSPTKQNPTEPYTQADHTPHTHSHGGVDPHIWVSPKALAQMAATAYGLIHEHFPDSVSYTANYERLAERLAKLDSEVSRRTAASPVRSFMIFHPGLSYYARDYGLRQIALETDGKEPSASQLAEIIALARAEKITKVLYQSEFSRRIVEIAAEEIGAEPVEIDILGYDIVGNILKITELIAGPDSAATAIPTASIPAVSESSISNADAL
jgi:zinc transport system substrate-binding protein